MREQEMRLRAFRFLKARMRNMIMPATVGIGLAVGGCNTSTPVPRYSTPVLPDSSSPVHDTNPAPNPDAVTDTSAPGAEVGDLLGRDAPVYGIDMNPPNLRDAAPDAGDAAADGRDASPTDEAVAFDSAVIDTSGDRMGVKYGAPDVYSGPEVGAPDMTRDGSGGGETALPVRYAAVMPPDASDAVMAAPLYMAPPPRDT